MEVRMLKTSGTERLRYIKKFQAFTWNFLGREQRVLTFQGPVVCRDWDWFPDGLARQWAPGKIRVHARSRSGLGPAPTRIRSCCSWLLFWISFWLLWQLFPVHQRRVWLH